MVLENLGLIRYILKKDFGWALSQGFGEDLFQQGVVGLIEAVNRFDKGRGVKFSVFATCWIKRYIYEGIHENIKFKEVMLKECIIKEEVDYKQYRSVAILIGLLEGEVRRRDIEILLYRYGFTTGKPETMASIAARYSISTTRVRQILLRLLDLIRVKGISDLRKWL